MRESNMHTEPRTVPIDRVYLHTNEGPQVLGGAKNLWHYLTTIDAGYHVIVDSQDTLVLATDDQVVWGAGGDNSHSLHVCMIGYASQDWTTPYSKAEIERAAQKVASWCDLHAIPVVHVRPGWPGSAPTDRGIAKHADNNDPRSQGHTDPGAGFPIDAFVARVNEILAPPSKLAAYFHLVAGYVKPIRRGDHGARVRFIKKLLRRKGYKLPEGDVYGPHMANAVKNFKQRVGLEGTGDVCGLPCLRKLLAK
jgi:N-acetyl-anhydromuramyl-L-alanine amidase AmpD